MRRSAALAAACLFLLAVAPAPAGALITAAETLEPPSADVVDFGGVAMAEDGTGGVVYRKRVDGRTHVFAAQFDGGWRRPQRIDAGQRFDSSWPAIGAANGGRLVVTWVQELGPESDRLFSATLDPGARRFGTPVPVDLNVGEATDTWPSLAMSRGGAAYLTYRVCADPRRTPNLPPGTVECELRLARYTGQLWSTFGFPVNRNPGSPVTTPTADNRPRVGIDPAGGGVLVFQERDDEFIDRVYARRIFGTTVGVPLLVSPQRIGDRPLRAPADQFDLDVSGFGQATVAFRQRPGSGGAQTGTRVYAATLPETFVAGANAFGAAVVADGAGPAGPPVPPGPVDAAGAPGGAAAVGFSLSTQSLLAPIDDRGRVGQLERLDEGDSADPGDPRIDLAGDGALAAAWRVRTGGRGQVALLERRADGVPESRTVFAARGGRVVDLELAGSGLGDALVGWQQGTDAFAQIAVAAIDAPPGEFGVQTPADFTRRRDRYLLRWDAPANAIGPVRYSVLIDDDEVADGLERERRELDLGRLDDGVLSVQVVARDGAGQETQSSPAALRLDRRAPRVAVQALGGRRLRVAVRDGARGQVSGADHAATRVAWGDGRRATGREGAFAITHRYRRAGRYRVTVRVRDAVGNARTVARRVRIR